MSYFEWQGRAKGVKRKPFTTGHLRSIPAPPTSSWWVGLTREEFQRALEAQEDRWQLQEVSDPKGGVDWKAQ